MVAQRGSKQRLPASTFVEAQELPACVVELDERIAHANAAWSELRPLTGNARGTVAGEVRDRLHSIVQEARRHGQAEGSLPRDGMFRARAEPIEGDQRLLVTLRPAATGILSAGPALLDGAPDPVARLTTEGQISYPNPALAHLAGRALGSLLGV